MKLKGLNSEYLFIVLLIAVSTTMLYFFTLISTPYTPYYGDEHFYFKNAESFYLTQKLEAVFTYSGLGSKVFGVDPHGPAYPLLYGGVAYLTGWHYLNIPLTNLALLLISCLILARYAIAHTKVKLMQLLVIMGSPMTLFYSITFLPELLQIAGGVLLFVVTQRYISTGKTRDFYLLVLLILLLGSIRSTWFFGLVGLIVLPGPIKGWSKTSYIILAVLLSFIFQKLFHEQVPNTFSGVLTQVTEGDYTEAFSSIYFNIKRNIYFALTYTEGHFYTLQKIWIALSLLVSFILFRNDRLVAFGLAILTTIMLFTLVLYKNFNWVELRMYTPMCLFINLAILSNSQKSPIPTALLSLNLISYILILPSLYTIMQYRVTPDVNDFPKEVIHEIESLRSPILFIEHEILYSYALDQLPVYTENQQKITYILPYYEMANVEPNYTLILEEDQFKVCSTKILNQ